MVVELNVELINQWGDVCCIDILSLVYDCVQFINIGYVVFFVEELVVVESFYCEVFGFQVLDCYINCVVFLCCGVCGGYYNFFLLQLFNCKCGLNYVVFIVWDIYEVIGGGIVMNKNVWSMFIGFGCYLVFLVYFWYVNSLIGGVFEYYINDDYLMENWQLCEFEYLFVFFIEWVVEGGIDYDICCQQKKLEVV